LYLLTFATVDSHRQQKVLSQILPLFQTAQQNSSTFLKRQRHYFRKLLLMYAAYNYRIISYYESGQLSTVLKDVKADIEYLKG
jgi:hypothetical protein